MASVGWAMSDSVLIVLATYQGAPYLAAQIESIRQQSWQQWTLLVRDDDSTDDTLAILQDYSRRDARIQCVQDTVGQLGPVGNFSRLLAIARQQRAQYVFLADQDDLWHPEKLRQQLVQLQQAEQQHSLALPLLVHADLRLIDAQGQMISPSFKRYQALPRTPSAPLAILLASNFVTGCTIGINRALLELATPLPPAVAMHDWWLALVAATSGQILYCDQPLVDYRQHSTNCVGGRRGWHSVRRLVRRLRQASSGQGEFVQSLGQAEVLLHRIQSTGTAYPADSRQRLLADYVQIWQTAPPWSRRLAQVRHLKVRRHPWLRTLVFYLEVIRWQATIK